MKRSRQAIDLRQLEHDLATPATILNGYIAMIRAGDVPLDTALPQMLGAALRLTVKLTWMTLRHGFRPKIGP